MSTVTIRILDGPDKGKEYRDISLPVSIGREEGNSIQLNDERVSRYHVRIQREDSEMFIADLNSTNGTRVNGEHVQLALIRPGDIIILGRTLMVVGTREQIIQRLSEYNESNSQSGAQLGMLDDDFQEMSSILLDKDLHWTDFPNAVEQLRTKLPPKLPAGLTPLQRAQLSELLQYYLLRFRRIVETGIPLRECGPESGVIPDKEKQRQLEESERLQNYYDKMVIPIQQWQNILDLYGKTAKYINETGEPDN